MPAYYTYLISSLPLLKFPEPPPFSYEKFISLCRGLIADDELLLLQDISKAPTADELPVRHGVLERWRDSERGLRNELAKIRASRHHIDTSRYLRPVDYTPLAIRRFAVSVYRNPSPLEAEKMIDQERWMVLDSLCLWHYFDIDFLIIYALKLLILEKWRRINQADSKEALEETLRSI